MDLQGSISMDKQTRPRENFEAQDSDLGLKLRLCVEIEEEAYVLDNHFKDERYDNEHGTLVCPKPIYFEIKQLNT